MLWSCSIQEPSEVSSTGSFSLPSIGSEEHLRLCLAPDSLPSDQKKILDAKVPAAVLERAIRSSVLVTFDTLYPDADNSCLKACSGTLIKVGNKTKVLTNQHCFADNFIRTGAGSRCAYEQRKADTFSNPCLNTLVHINFPADAQKQTISLACQGGFTADKELDLAVFDIDALPADQPHASFWQGEVAADQEAFLLHHPLCEANNFRIIPNTSIGAMIKTITFADCRIATPPAGTDRIFSLQSNTFHSCVTTLGSSGAGILDAKTGAILAVHRAMVKLTDPGAATTHHYGHGTSISAVQNFIADIP